MSMTSWRSLHGFDVRYKEMSKGSISIHSGRLSVVRLGLEGSVIGNFIGNSTELGWMKNR